MSFDDGADPLYAVIDPGSFLAPIWASAVGTRAIEVSYPVVEDPRFYKVDLASLSLPQLFRLCRGLARFAQVSFDVIVFNALMGNGIDIPSTCVYLCRNPAEGVAFYAVRRPGKRKGSKDA